ncbi:hypothetical protein ACFSX9_05740 [Flavobacterium ardleyense]|uniref:Uncharacterized protein n=1 Tax=Flavobacterium ardleyense TaxID=2038737 RepID=A0ABW5Z6F6_9FLAO
MRPNYMQALFMLLLLLVCAGIVYLMLFNNVRSWFGWGFMSLLIALFSLFLFDSFFELSKGQTLEQKNKNKDRLEYFDDNMTIDCPYLQIKEIIKWNSIEAIFLSNRPPGDGEYHNFEYTVILNSDPEEVKYETQSWFNKTSFLPKLKKRGLPIVRINDDSNRDFHTFNDAIAKYLVNVNVESHNYLSLKFGNEVEYKKTGNTVKATGSKQMKSMGFYKIFDRENDLNDETLDRFREETKNNK